MTANDPSGHSSGPSTNGWNRPTTAIRWDCAQCPLRISKRTFEPIAAAQKDLLLGYVGFGIGKRKSLGCADFVAL